MKPSHPLSSPSPSAVSLSQHQGLFQWVSFFALGGQSIGVSASASVLPMNIQDWFPLELTGLISLRSKGLSRAFSNTTVQKHQSVFIPIPKKGNAKECSNYHTVALITQASKVMLKILQVRLQQYVNQELPDVQAGFRKGRGTRDKIANICWIIKKARYSRKTSTALLTLPKALCRSQQTGKFLRDGNTRPPDLPPEKSVCR